MSAPDPFSPPAKPDMHTAVALAYAAGQSAPTVVAKGKGLIADEIIARAKEHGIYVHESKELVALLMNVDLDQHIPAALYRIVAELLAWLYHVESAKAAGNTDAESLPKLSLPAIDEIPPPEPTA
jgi:flagellar biosynthesis protein